MLLDRLNQFSAAQAITSTAVSTDVIDLAPLGIPTDAAINTVRDIGAGEELHFTVQSIAAFAAGGAATLTVSLESSANADLSSSLVHWTGPTLALAALTANTTLFAGFLLPPGAYRRYLGLRYTVATGPMTAGTVNAWLHKGRVDTRTYGTASKSGVN